jgi:hypothetical protein
MSKPDAERFPLYWPEGQPRSKYRRSAPFKVEFVQARDEMMHSLELIGARTVIVSTNVPIRPDGLPRGGIEPGDPGVAVYFDRRVENVLVPFVIACDAFSKVRWNIRAVGGTVEALRAIQRYGATSMLEQAFRGFAALPEANKPKPWWEVLGVSQTSGPVAIRSAYLELVALHHPDRGGDHLRMAEINRAFEEGQRASRASGT